MSTPPGQDPGANAATLTPAQWSITVTPVVAALTTLCAATALSGVIDGLRWLGYAGVAVVVVTATGLGLRAVRAPTLLVGLAQIFSVLCLLVALFTNSGVLGVLPGPSALADVGDVLRRSVEIVRTGVPPVDPTAAVLCLVVLAIGLVAVLVDTLAVAAGTPAACGLVLLCVYAVPASLADEMLPWWSFVLGASSFALLLAVDGAHRHQLWRNRPAMPGTGAGIGSPAGLVSGALAIALLAGATITAIGTVGQLPGGTGGGGAGGLGLKPFTQLRGMLDQDGNVELFRIRGLGDENRYMRVMTLARYDRNGGWALDTPLPQGRPADRDLPPGPGDDGSGPTRAIQVESVSSQDLWVGVYGIPRRLDGVPRGLRYDPNSGMIYSETSRKLPTYTEQADLSQPDVNDLRRAGTDYRDIDPIYRQSDGINERVARLARELTSGRGSAYDKAMALQAYFDPSNGFSYQTETGVGSDEDALTDFLFRTKAGYCEQYASAMAILARASGLPSRVAMGFTAGFPSNDYRSITTQDAHAWVEVFFPGQGWVAFDPTPLTDGRSYTPPYATSSLSGPSDDPSVDSTASTDITSTPNSGADQRENAVPGVDNPAAAGQQQQGGWIGWTAGTVALLAALLTVLVWLAASGRLGVRTGLSASGRRRFGSVAAGFWVFAAVLVVGAWSWGVAALLAVLVLAAAPGAVRAWRRWSHRHAVDAQLPSAASAAWTELLDESWDRGAEPHEAETVRTVARRLALEHELDEDGKRALRTMVTEVERSWYGGQRAPGAGLAGAFRDTLAGLRRSSPLGLRSRLLPRSVLRPRRGKTRV